MIVAVIPVLGRGLLVRHTVGRLVRQKIHVVVVCQYVYEFSFFEGIDKKYLTLKVCYGKNLGFKWNYGFIVAKELNPDAILYVGSSDWVTDNWIDSLSEYLNGADYVGVQDYYLAHFEFNVPYDKSQKYDDLSEQLNRVRVGHWIGYSGPRMGEPIGIGRLLSRKFLDRINFMPFDNNLNKNLDHSMHLKAQNVVSLRCDDHKCLSISTTLWSNKHNYFVDMDNSGSKILNVKFLNKYFPESLNFYKNGM